MVERTYNVLFLCTSNSARSIMAECALDRWGAGHFRSYSAGSQPKDRVHPMTLRLLRQLNYDVSHLRSKSWDEFAQPGAPSLNFVFRVCDQVAGEMCPAWLGQPMTAHWGVEDPAAFVGSQDKTLAFFRRIYTYLDNRIKLFISLPIASLDKLSLQLQLEAIGRAVPETSAA
jgi:arsenate reductase